MGLNIDFLDETNEVKEEHIDLSMEIITTCSTD